jgi:hypothetical protein
MTHLTSSSNNIDIQSLINLPRKDRLYSDQEIIDIASRTGSISELEASDLVGSVYHVEDYFRLVENYLKFRAPSQKSSRDLVHVARFYQSGVNQMRDLGRDSVRNRVLPENSSELSVGWEYNHPTNFLKIRYQESWNPFKGNTYGALIYGGDLQSNFEGIYEGLLNLGLRIGNTGRLFGWEVSAAYQLGLGFNQNYQSSVGPCPEVGDVIDSAERLGDVAEDKLNRVIDERIGDNPFLNPGANNEEPENEDQESFDQVADETIEIATDLVQCKTEKAVDNIIGKFYLLSAVDTRFSYYFNALQGHLRSGLYLNLNYNFFNDKANWNRSPFQFGLGGALSFSF